MAMLCALDWRHDRIQAGITADPTGGARLTLGRGADEVVVHLGWASLDALTLAALTCPRLSETPTWTPSRPSSR